MDRKEDDSETGGDIAKKPTSRKRRKLAIESSSAAEHIANIQGENRPQEIVHIGVDQQLPVASARIDPSQQRQQTNVASMLNPLPNNDSIISQANENSNFSSLFPASARETSTGTQLPNIYPFIPIQTSGFPLLNQRAVNVETAFAVAQLMSAPGLLGMHAPLHRLNMTLQSSQQPSITIENPSTHASLPLSQQILPRQPERSAPPEEASTGRKSGPLLYLKTDDNRLSDDQILLRKQIEFFEASLYDVGKTTSGRRNPILLNQVGIQCIHCKNLPFEKRQRGAVYYPAKLIGIYQAATNMGSTHITGGCKYISEDIKEKLKKTGNKKRGYGGKEYWADTAKAQGVDESAGGGLHFTSNRTSSEPFGIG